MCYEDLGLPSVRYLLPIVVYETDAKGACISTNLENKVLALGKDSYEAILIVKDNFGDITNSDLIITCSDETYQKLQIQAMGVCNYKKSKKLVQEVEEFWTDNMQYLVQGVAREMTPTRYMELKNSGKDSSIIPSQDAFKDLL